MHSCILLIKSLRIATKKTWFYPTRETPTDRPHAKPQRALFFSKCLQRGEKSYTIILENLIMQISPDLMRLMLLMCMLAMVLLSVFYLRRRRLALLAYAAWGLAAILIPIIGPFFVIWMRPGQRIRSQR